MTTETHPVVSEAMREAVLQYVSTHETAYRNLSDFEVWLLQDFASGPIASEIAAPIIATALAEARAEGRRQGLKEAAKLREALEPYRSGGSWGGWLAWLIAGAPDREKGKAAAKQIVRWQTTADMALATNTPETQKPGETG